MEPSKYLEIAAIDGYSALQRANAISEELFSISRPVRVRQPDDVTKALFQVLELGGKVYMQVDLVCVIPVHPDNNLDRLASLFPNLSEAERNGLVAYIESSQEFVFKDILPAGTVLLQWEDIAQ